MPIHSPVSNWLIRRALWLALLALSGCGGGGSGGEDATSGLDAPAALCPSADLAAAASVVFVSAEGSDSDHCGASAATPCASIARGIARCGVAGCAVLVRHGLYPTTETIALRDAVSVHGSCLFGDEPDRHYRTVIAAAPPAGMPAIDAAGINSATVVSGLMVLGKDETAAGEASMAMRVSASRGLTLAAVTLSAGRGGDGAPGKSMGGGSGGNGASPVCPDCIENAPGGLACPGEPAQPAGRGGAGTEPYDFTVPYDSCLAACKCTAVDQRKKIAPQAFVGQDSGRARGGMYGENGSSGPACEPLGVPPPGAGQSAHAGELGDCAQGGGRRSPDNAGRPGFADGRWLASSGAPGERGANGSGGGGGGAGGYAFYFELFNPNARTAYRGLPGGGGGGGGCGGAGGAGGQQGGASIPLALVNSAVGGLDSAALAPGPGGQGGRGGDGGAGGAGGLGAPASLPQRRWPLAPGFMVPGLGGKGGDGGAGGAGAGGAGGNGGPSMALALVGNSSTPDPGPGLAYPGAPGAPGQRGDGRSNPLQPDSPNSQCASAGGEDGAAGSTAPVLRFGESS